jgi:hypothetical protein
VIEDAHCLSRHGHRLDPCYAYAAVLAEEAHCVLALSDVADEQTRHEIATRLDLREDVVTGLNLPQVRLQVKTAPGRSRRETLLLSLMEACTHRAVVCVRTRDDAHAVARVVEDRCGLPSVVVTSDRGEEFVAALRSFREGSARVLITCAAFAAEPGWPDVPLVVIYSLPRSPEMLHRQARLATGEGARVVLLYDRSENEDAELLCMRAGPEAGHLLAVHAAFTKEARIDYPALGTATGLSADDLHRGVEMLIRAGALRVSARGDDWVEADTQGKLAGEMLTECARECHLLRRARLEQAAQVLAVARTRRCRRNALAEALGYEIGEDSRCLCDRCDPSAGELC